MELRARAVELLREARELCYGDLHRDARVYRDGGIGEQDVRLFGYMGAISRCALMPADRGAAALAMMCLQIACADYIGKHRVPKPKALFDRAIAEVGRPSVELDMLEAVLP